MAKRRTYDSVFDEGSQPSVRALVGLHAVLECIGYKALRKRRHEHTLRVYLKQRDRYPLLNPRFVRQVDELPGRGPFLEVHVWSKGNCRGLDQHLRGYGGSTGARFIARREWTGGYYLHGRFLMPASFKDAACLLPDFAALGLRLKTLRRHLETAVRKGGRGD